MRATEFHDVTVSLLAQTGFTGQFEMHLLSGGANNRIYRIDVGNHQLCLKVYFQHPDDPRDRLGAEFSFSSFAWDIGIRALPQPLACNRDGRVALYEFIPGRRLKPGQVTLDSIQQALRFYLELNRYKDEPEAKALPKASESCFSIGDHLQRVSYRLNRLTTVEDSTPIDRDATLFIRSELWGAWKEVVKSVQREAGRLDLDVEEEIPRSDWCLSPSDFGFHNAILTADGNLRFIDFEYAGWDDPNKLVCDFFCQPAVPAPLDYYDAFAETVAGSLSEPENHLKRMNLLLPVYQIKWCCIVLNEFLPTGSYRRRFADGGADQNERKTVQLQKARQALKRLITLDDQTLIKSEVS